MTQPTNKETPRIASAPIACNACMWLKLHLEPIYIAKLTESEKKTVNKAQNNDFKIYPGESYIEEEGEYLGKPYISQYIKAIHEICLKYELYTYAGDQSKKIKVT